MSKNPEQIQLRDVNFIAGYAYFTINKDKQDILVLFDTVLHCVNAIRYTIDIENLEFADDEITTSQKIKIKKSVFKKMLCCEFERNKCHQENYLKMQSYSDDY